MSSPSSSSPANADHVAHRLADELAREWIDTPPPDPVADNVLAPVAYATLLDDLLAEARQRPTHAYTAAGADATVLRSAGSIAGKLG